MTRETKSLHALVAAARSRGLTGAYQELQPRIEAEANAEGLSDLTPDHWAVIQYVLDYYRITHQSPPAVRIGRTCRLGIRQLDALFPSGVVRSVFRWAEMEMPPDLPQERSLYWWN